MLCVARGVAPPVSLLTYFCVNLSLSVAHTDQWVAILFIYDLYTAITILLFQSPLSLSTTMLFALFVSTFFFIFNSFEIHRFNMSKEITLRWLSISSWNKCHRSCLDRKEDWQGYAGLTPIARGGYLRVTNRSRVNLLRVSWAVSVRDPFLTPQNNALH